MVFGRKKSGDDELRANHREYFRNCLIQIGDLESRTTQESWRRLIGQFDSAWTSEAVAEEITQKVALARKFADDLEPKLTATTIDAAGQALELLQEIIDNAERQIQGVLAGLVFKQAQKSTGL